MTELGDRDLTEVYECKPGLGRPYFTHKPGSIALLAADAPLPRIGDLINLPRAVTGDSEEQAFLLNGAGAPFRVLDVEHMYGEPPRDHPDKGSPCLKAWIHVRRLTEDEYAADPGSAM